MENEKKYIDWEGRKVRSRFFTHTLDLMHGADRRKGVVTEVSNLASARPLTGPRVCPFLAAGRPFASTSHSGGGRVCSQFQRKWLRGWPASGISQHGPQVAWDRCIWSEDR